MVAEAADASSDDQEFQSFDEEIDAEEGRSSMAPADSVEEEEFHTEDESDQSGDFDSDEENEPTAAALEAVSGSGEAMAEDNDDGDLAAAALLPPELLNAAPRALTSTHLTFDPSTEQLTRRQKMALRNRSRQAKKRNFERLRRDSAGTGVLEAGRVAQLKRKPTAAEGSQAGRIAKRRAPKTSGRDKVLLERQKEVEQRHKTFARPAEEKGGRKGRRSRR